MKITRAQYQKFRGICRKLGYSPNQIHLKKVLSAGKQQFQLLKPRFIVAFTLKCRGNGNRRRCFVQCNVLKRIDLLYHLKNRLRLQQKRRARSWRKIQRKIDRIQVNEDTTSEEGDVTETPPRLESQEVRNQIKTQLHLLQQGRRKSLHVAVNDEPEEENLNVSVNSQGQEEHTNSKDSTIHLLQNLCDSDVEMAPLVVSHDDSIECASKNASLEFDQQNCSIDELEKTLSLLNSKTPEKNESMKKVIHDLDIDIKVEPEEIYEGRKIETETTCTTEENTVLEHSPKNGFLDSLLKKIKQESDDDFLPLIRNFGMRKKPVCASPTDDFLGFDEEEIPGMLPTPKVENHAHSAFVDRFGATELVIKLEAKSPSVDSTDHDGMVCAGSKPPALAKPKRLINVTKPRTVAEKRQLLLKKKGIKFLMMENEARISNELRKISKGEDYLLVSGTSEINYQMINKIQQESVPFRRDAWRALCWLRTEKNRFYYKVLHVDGVKCNLLGSRGNYDGKRKLRATSTPLPKMCQPSLRTRCCKPIKFNQNWKINLQVPDDIDPKVVPRKLLDFDKQVTQIKPGPLCYKLRQQNHRMSMDECMGLGPSELVRLPPIELEVFPQIGRPLDSSIIPLMRSILPHEKITDNWARFASSIIKSDDDKEDERFSFSIPYENNYDKVHIKHRNFTAFFAKDNAELIEDLEKPLVSLQAIKPDDELGQEIGHILTDMTNSVAIGMAEASFSKHDPDIDYEQIDRALEPPETVRPPAPGQQSLRSQKVVRELRKLNATFITADTKSEVCTKKYCERGCICDSLGTAWTFKSHCKKQECMLECKCSGNRLYVNDHEIKECNLTSDAVKSLREKATARLARVEKDFTPTILVSNDNTYLISNSDREHARRSKRMPKKFEDYAAPTILEQATEQSQSAKFKPIKFKDPFEAAVHQLRHVNVTLRPLVHIANVEPWCMVHQLYKCFCLGDATDGKPLTFDDNDAVEERYDYKNRKRTYVFERESEPTPKVKRLSLDSSSSRSMKTRENSFESKPSLSRNSSFEAKIDLVPSAKQPKITEKTLSGGCERVYPVALKYRDATIRKTKIAKMKKKVAEYEQRHPENLALLRKRMGECEDNFLREMHEHGLALDRTVPEPPLPPPTPAPAPQPTSRIRRKSTQLITTQFSRRKLTAPEKEKIKTYPIRFNITNSEEEIQKIAALKPLIENKVLIIIAGKSNFSPSKDDFYGGKLDFEKIKKATNRQVFIIEKTEHKLANHPKVLKSLRVVRRAKECSIAEVINIMMAPDSDEVKALIQKCNDDLDDEDIEVAIPPDRQRLNVVNTIITRHMQHICMIQKQCTKHLVRPVFKKLFYYRWECMIHGFQQELLFVWEIKLADGNEAVIITLQNARPEIDSLATVINIRSVTMDHSALSLVSKMLLLKVENEQTKYLSLILYGGRNYWRICGFMKSDINYCQIGVVAKPTPATHPSLSAKINLFFNDLNKGPNGQLSAGNSLVVSPKSNASIQQAKSYVTNINFFSADLTTLKSLFLPIPPIGEHRWFMLDLCADFSDIYIPAWKSYLTYDRVVYAIKLARNHGKTVRVTIQEKFPEVYATPEHENRIFFGPYKINQNIDYVLCQNFDGQIISREEYQQRCGIKSLKSTRGSWLYLKRVAGEAKQEPSSPSVANSFSNSSNRISPSPEPECILPDDPENEVPVTSISKLNPKPEFPAFSFKISSVQTITDPNLIPIDDSDDEKDAVKPIQLDDSGTTKNIKASSNDASTSSHSLIRRPNETKPLVMTVSKDKSGYSIKNDVHKKNFAVRPSTVKNGTIAGRKIPLNSIGSLKPVPAQYLKSNLTFPPSTIKQTVNPTDSKNTVLVKTSKPIPKASNVVERKILNTPSQLLQVKNSTTSAEKKNPVVLRKTFIPKITSLPKPLTTTDQEGNKCRSTPLCISITPVTDTKTSVVSRQSLPSTSSMLKKIVPQPVVQVSLQSFKGDEKIASLKETKSFTFGYFVSNVPILGRIRAKFDKDKIAKYMVKISKSGGQAEAKSFYTINEASIYLNSITKPCIYAFLPENFTVTWVFQNNKEFVEKYADFDPQKIPKRIVVTSYGHFNLEHDWSTLEIIASRDKNIFERLLAMKMFLECFSQAEMLNSDVLVLLKISHDEINTLLKAETELETTKADLQQKHKQLKEEFEKLEKECPREILFPSKERDTQNKNSVIIRNIVTHQVSPKETENKAKFILRKSVNLDLDIIRSLKTKSPPLQASLVKQETQTIPLAATKASTSRHGHLPPAMQSKTPEKTVTSDPEIDVQKKAEDVTSTSLDGTSNSTETPLPPVDEAGDELSNSSEDSNNSSVSSIDEENLLKIIESITPESSSDGIELIE